MDEQKKDRLNKLKIEYDKKIKAADELLRKKQHNVLDGGEMATVTALMLEYEKEKIAILNEKE